MEKRCSKCGELRPLDQFYRATGTRDGLRGDCKACFKERAAARHRANPVPARERVKRWQQENPERYAARQRAYVESGKKRVADRKSHLKRTFGLTLEEYDAMLAAQGGGCAICGRPPRDDIALHVDHCHITGRVRGLLCFRCNNALGDLENDIELLRQASGYLETAEVAMARARLHALVAAS